MEKKLLGFCVFSLDSLSPISLFFSLPPLSLYVCMFLCVYWPLSILVYVSLPPSLSISPPLYLYLSVSFSLSLPISPPRTFFLNTNVNTTVRQNHEDKSD